jgi:cytochrome c oxidase subunit II
MDTTSTFWLPPSVSTVSGEVDSLFMFLIWMSVFFFVLIVAGTLFFITKWRRSKNEAATLDTGPTHNSILEATWIIVPTLLVLVIFVWSFRTYMKMSIVPPNAMEVKVTGQKWFWSFAYPEGGSSVNELIVPVDMPVKLLMSSQDVIHSFFVPAFRVKKDVLPNRYSIAWFEATAVGEYDLFCTEFCGTKHSEMIGKVRVVSRDEFEVWQEEAMFSGEGMTMAEYGERLYTNKACLTCHTVDGTPANGPTWQGIWGTEEFLTDGTSVTVDENYVRESILNPRSKIVAGYQPIMPTYQGLLSDKEIDALVAYIKEVGGGGE